MQSWAATLHSRAFLPTLLTTEMFATINSMILEACIVVLCSLQSGRPVLVTKEGAAARLKNVTSLQSTAV
jgi:hypothetical protein